MHKIGKQILASILTVSMILQPTIISYADEAITKTTESENGSVEMNLEQTVKLVDEESKDSESSVSNNAEKIQKDLKDKSQEIKEDSESSDINETVTKKETDEKVESENTNQENQKDIENEENTDTETTSTSEEKIVYPTELTTNIDNTSITVKPVSGNTEDLNGAVSFIATRLSEERENEYKDIIDKTIDEIYVYDLALFNDKKEQIEPTGELEVTFSLNDLSISEEQVLEVYHNVDTTLENVIPDNENKDNGENVKVSDIPDNNKTELVPINTIDIPIKAVNSSVV